MDIAARIGSQKDHGSGHVVRVAPPPRGDAFQDLAGRRLGQNPDRIEIDIEDEVPIVAAVLLLITNNQLRSSKHQII